MRSLQGNLIPRPGCIDREIARSIRQGRRLRFPCTNGRGFEISYGSERAIN